MKNPFESEDEMIKHIQEEMELEFQELSKSWANDFEVPDFGDADLSHTALHKFTIA